MGASFRDAVEEGLLRVPGVRPLNERDARHISDFKDGTFGLSYLGLLLYCTGRNPRGASSRYPKGMLYFDRENLFGVGVFRREGESDGGHLMAVAPRGLNAVGAIERFSDAATAAAPKLRGNLFFVRFLKLEQYKQLLQRGFEPVQEQPWHEEAFAEDETYAHSVIRLSDAFEYSDNLSRQPRLQPKSKWNREALNRFKNFLSRSKLQWRWGDYDAQEAKQIVGAHFRMLEKEHKRVGSMPEDYWNILETAYPDKFSAIGRLAGNGIDVPVSVFVGEKVSDHKLALYCSISRRTPDLLQELRVSQTQGFGALSTHALLNVFAEIKRRMPEIEEIDMGGSETPDLNAFKRRLGARNHPTYWAVKRL